MNEHKTRKNHDKVQRHLQFKTGVAPNFIQIRRKRVSKGFAGQ